MNLANQARAPLFVVLADGSLHWEFANGWTCIPYIKHMCYNSYRPCSRSVSLAPSLSSSPRSSSSVPKSPYTDIRQSRFNTVHIVDRSMGRLNNSNRKKYCFIFQQHIVRLTKVLIGLRSICGPRNRGQGCEWMQWRCHWRNIWINECYDGNSAYTNYNDKSCTLNYSVITIKCLRESITKK